MTKKDYKKETVNGNTIVTVGKVKVFLNCINQNSLLKAMEFNQNHFDFVSFYTTGQNNKNDIIYVSAVNKGMNSHNWNKFFKVFGVSSNHPIVEAVTVMSNALSKGEAIRKLSDVPNNGVASSPTANLDTSEIVNQVIRQLKEGLLDK